MVLRDAIQSAARYNPATRSPARDPRLDPNRIIGISGTIAFNVVMLLVLLAPLSRPEHARLPDPPQAFEWITAQPQPPDPPPVPVEEIRPAQPQPQPPLQRLATPVAEAPVVIERGSLPADPVVKPAAEATASIEHAAPREGVRLEYREAPAPRYPRDALLAGIEGTVLLQVLVAADGRPLEVAIHRSSGHRVLDEAARRQVLRAWRFRPAMQDGRAVQALGLVPVDFRLGH